MFRLFKSRTSRNWERIYVAWKKANPLFSKDERVRIVRQCKWKFAYGNFLDLLKAADRLSKDETFIEGRYINVYQCEVCGMGHIGNQRTAVDIGDDWQIHYSMVIPDEFPGYCIGTIDIDYKKFILGFWDMSEEKEKYDASKN